MQERSRRGARKHGMRAVVSAVAGLLALVVEAAETTHNLDLTMPIGVFIVVFVGLWLWDWVKDRLNEALAEHERQSEVKVEVEHTTLAETRRVSPQNRDEIGSRVYAYLRNLFTADGVVSSTYQRDRVDVEVLRKGVLCTVRLEYAAQPDTVVVTTRRGSTAYRTFKTLFAIAGVAYIGVYTFTPEDYKGGMLFIGGIVAVVCLFAQIWFRLRMKKRYAKLFPPDVTGEVETRVQEIVRAVVQGTADAMNTVAKE